MPVGLGFRGEKCDVVFGRIFWHNNKREEQDEVYSTTVRPVWSTTVGRMLFRLRSTAAGGGEDEGGGGEVDNEGEDDSGGGK